MKPFMLLCISSLLLPLGCASIVSKSTYPVTIDTTPSGSDVEIFDEDGHSIHRGITPLTLDLSAKGGYFSGQDYLVKLSHPQYGERDVQISSRLDGWYVGNLVFGGLLGFLVIDPLTGAMWRLSPNEINEDLSVAPKEPEAIAISE